MPRDLGRQWAYWRAEWRRRLLHWRTSRLSPQRNQELVRALELRGQPQGIDLRTGFPRVQDVRLACVDLAPAVELRIPAQGELLCSDDHWYSPVRAHVLHKVLLDADSGLIFTRGWVVSPSGTGHRGAWDSAFITGATVRVGAVEPQSRPGAVAPLGDVENHYHFLMETLPRALRAREVDGGVEFVTTSVPSAFAQSRMDELGLAVAQLAPGTVLRPERVVLVEPEPRDRTHPAQLQLIADTFLPPASEQSLPARERLYVSRRGSSRSLRHEERLESFLSEQGFAIVRLEELSFAEQVARLSVSRVVIGPHGAGLANCVFMPPGGRIVELATGEWWSHAFRRLAAARGHDYRLLLLGDGPDAPFGDADDAVEALREIIPGL